MKEARMETDRNQPNTVSAAMMHDLVQAIVSALEARDPTTANHSLRVGNMVEALCRFLPLSHAEAQTIHMAAHVHDIGKIALPDAIVHRTARLTPEEHVLLHQHASIGAAILRSTGTLDDMAAIVEHHHERWDGTGYPAHLAGEAIPYGARVVAVCDSIDAMMGKCAPSRRLTAEQCRHEIAAQAGRAYDPVIAGVLLAHWDEVVEPIEFPPYFRPAGSESEATWYQVRSVAWEPTCKVPYSA